MPKKIWIYEEFNKHPKPSSCSGCPLADLHIGASFARTSGTGANGVLLLGEALGESEALAGEPFVGAAGHMLTSILHKNGWKKADFLIANTVNCNPHSNHLEGAWYETEAITRCAPYLEETLERNPQIKVIVPLGNIPLHRCLNVKGVKNFHGTATWHKRWKRWIVPSLHPSYILQSGQKEVPTSSFDIGRALHIAVHGWDAAKVEYWEYPTPEDMRKFVELYEAALAADPGTWLSVDIETPYSVDEDEEDREDKDLPYEIIRASLSFREGFAISFPYSGEYIKLFGRALASAGSKVWWNGNKFDIPRLRAAGHFLNGQHIDGMDAWHFLYPDLPRSLGYVSPFFTSLPAWKHLASSHPEYYSAQDAWAALAITTGVRRELEKLGSWDIFIRDFVNLEPVFTDFHEVGIGIDEAARSRLRTHYEALRDNATTLIQESVPREVKPWLKKEGYKGKPKEVREYLKEHPDVADEEAWKAFGYELAEFEGELRWNRREEFNPNSTQQILNYISKRYGEKAVPKHKKTGKPTAGAEEIERLARRHKDRTLELIVDASDADTKLATFINNWPIAEDGRVHPIFTNVPATFRLSSKHPNSQNFPHRDAEAKEMRKMVVPGEGWDWLVEADYTGIEAILVGWYAKDDQYIRLAKRGVHDFLAAHMMARDGKYEVIPLTLSDNDLTIALRECKKVSSKLLMPGSAMSYRDGAKPTVHGSNYGMGPHLMYRNHPEVFGSPKEAEALQGLYFDIFPSIPRWQNEVVERAYWDCRIVSAFNYHRRFYNVKRWSFNKRLDKWELVWADDAKKAIATLPQGSAAAIIRRAMLSEPFRLLRAERCAIMQIHDALLARARDEAHRDWVIQQLIEAMVYPIAEMGGLVIPVEVKAGRNWGEMKAVEV